MFVQLGDRILNLDHVHCIDFDPDGSGASVALRSAPARGADRMATVGLIRLGREEAAALRTYLCVSHRPDLREFENGHEPIADDAFKLAREIQDFMTDQAPATL